MVSFTERVKEKLLEKGYVLGKEFSHNNNTRVHLAEHDGKRVIVKAYSALFIPDIDQLDIAPSKLEVLAVREISILQKLDHPTLPKLIDTFDVEPIEGLPAHVAVMEYIEKPSLREIMGNGHKLREAEAKKVLEGILSGLHYLSTAFEQPVYHRDIKPSNILVSDAGAHLVDFNFCHVGSGDSFSTMIVTFGYYPLDAYSGRVDPTHDLVALGNVVLAGMFGNEIANVRIAQGIGDLETPVNISSLPISAKFASYLRKLTTPKAGLRYQSAAAALADLKNMDAITEAAMAEALESHKRDPRLEQLLAELHKQDPCFKYNVPPKLREVASDKALFDHIEHVYGNPVIEINDPDAIRQYAAPGDKVRAKTQIEDTLAKVENGDEGRITSIADKIKVGVQFPNGSMAVLPTDLEVLIYDGIFIKRIKERKRGDGVQLECGQHVCYVGAPQRTVKVYVERDTEGIVINNVRGNSDGLTIVWEGTAATTAPLVEHHEVIEGKYMTYYRSERTFSADSLVLLKKNPINLKELVESTYKQEKTDAK